MRKSQGLFRDQPLQEKTVSFAFLDTEGRYIIVEESYIRRLMRAMKEIEKKDMEKDQ